ncbi:MAG: ATP-binding protein [Cyclobacteriaceae bacterium]
MDKSKYTRKIEKQVLKYIKRFSVTAILGARQVGKSTLAKRIIGQYDKAIYLDMERESDRKKLTSPEDFFTHYKDYFICIDEVQLYPNLFSTIRSIVDDYDTHFLILGSSSTELLRQSSETLAGRIIYHKLTPFLYPEIQKDVSLKEYWQYGGFPQSILQKDREVSFTWIENYVFTFLERDISQLGLNVSTENLSRLWRMLAYQNGQQLNYSQLAKSLGVSHATVRNHIDILKYTFMVRLLEPYHTNLSKRLVKQPKVYLRDTGVLHTLLGIESHDQLYNHPIYGHSFETMVVENLIAMYPRWQAYYYRTSNGAEIDLLLVKGERKIAFEIKATSSPKLSRGFWSSLADLEISEAYVIATIQEKYPLKNNVWVISFEEALQLEL